MGTAGRIDIKKESDGITLRIKSKRSWFALLYIPFVLTAWAVAWAVLFNNVLKGQSWGYSDVLSWLMIWLMFAAIPIFALLWNIWGEEVISISGEQFTRKLSVGGFGPKRSFPVNEVFNVRTSGFNNSVDKEMSDRFWWPLGMAEQTVAVTTIYLTEYTFGIRLEESEAGVVAKALEPYLSTPSNYSLNPTGYSVPPIRRS